MNDVTAKPSTLPPILEQIPAELRALDRWVLWRWELRDDEWTKPPHQPNGRYAKSTVPATWSTFGDAWRAYEAGGFDGIGVAMTSDDDIAGVDLDHCVTDGVVDPWALAVTERIASYTEVSPSGTGLRIIVNAKLPAGGRKRGNVEVYETGRYLTITGHKLAPAPTMIEHRQEQIDAFHAEHFPAPEQTPRPATNGSGHLTDSQVLDLIRGSKQAAKFEALYRGDDSIHNDDTSVGDLALVAQLAFYTQDEQQLDRLFQGSGRARDKWTAKRGNSTYGARTIAKALADVDETYTPPTEPKQVEAPYEYRPPPPPPSDGHEPASPLDLAIERERVKRQARRIVDAEERPPAELPDFISLEHRLAHPPPPVAWRIDKWQPAGSRVLLAAQYKAGKTTLTGNLVRSLVDGDRFLGFTDVEPVKGTVAILDFEMPKRQFYEWLRDQDLTDTARVWPLAMRGNGGAFDILNDDIRAKWVDRLRANDVDYLVWDCVRPVVDALGLNEHNEMGPLLVKFDQLLTEAGVADACVIHHMGHSGERSRGDSRLRDWPDAEWRLVREDADNPASPRYISAYGRDVAVGESRLAFDSVTRRLSIAGGSRRDAKAERAAEAIAEWLAAQDEPQSTRKIEEAIDGHPRKAVRDGLARLVTTGDVEVKPGPGRARLHRIAGQQTRDTPSAERTLT